MNDPLCEIHSWNNIALRIFEPSHLQVKQSKSKLMGEVNGRAYSPLLFQARV